MREDASCQYVGSDFTCTLQKIMSKNSPPPRIRGEEEGKPGKILPYGLKPTGGQKNNNNVVDRGRRGTMPCTLVNTSDLGL
jgi:hypothetical protein